MALDPITAVLDVGGKLIDKLFPDPAQRDAAKLAMLQAKQKGDLDEITVSMSAILAEAKSADPWTSRARPSFLYVVYLLILSAIPMGILHAISPETAISIADGFKAWLEAIPDDIVSLFQWVMLGYIGSRGMEKIKGAAK